MTTGMFLHISLAGFCAILFLWLLARFWREIREKPANIIGCLLLGAACCTVAFSVMSYLVIRTTIFDWTMQQDTEIIRALRLYIFTGLIYLLAFAFSIPASEMFKKRLPPKAIQAATLLEATLFVLWNMVGDLIKVIGK
jgi:hypothetical protein